MTPFPGLAQVTDDGKVTGILSPLFSFFADISRLINVTVVPSDSVGVRHPVTGLFTGCLGRLQRNECDTLIPPAPIFVHGSGFGYGYAAISSRILIGSSYNSSTSDDHVDAMDAFKAFSLSLWTIFALFLAIMTGLTAFFTLTLRVIRLQALGDSSDWKTLAKRLLPALVRRAIKISAGNALKQLSSYDFSWTRTSVRLLHLTLVLYAFMISFYFMSMIKTETVVQRVPATITSFQDILDRPEVRPVWQTQLGDFKRFRDADSQSKEGRIWRRAQVMGLNESLVEGSTDTYLEFLELSAKQKAVGLIASYFRGIVRTNTCALVKRLNINSWKSIYTTAASDGDELLTSYDMSTSTPPRAARVIRFVLQSLLEFDITHKELKAGEFLVYNDDGSREVRNCLSDTVIMPDHRFASPALSHYTKLFTTIAGLLLASNVCFFMEHLLVMLRFRV